MSRIRLAFGISIALVVVARFVAGRIISRSHPYDFDPHKHQAVVNIVVQAPTADGEDFDEYDIPGVWWDPLNKSFHTQYDGRSLDYNISTGSRHLAADLFAGGLIVLLLVAKRILLLKRGIQNTLATDYPAGWFLGKRPTARYAAMASVIMLGTVFVLNRRDRGSAKKVVVVDLVVVHQVLYRDFYYGSPEQVIEWGKESPGTLRMPLALPPPDER
jgi:hypothetical protein